MVTAADTIRALLPTEEILENDSDYNSGELVRWVHDFLILEELYGRQAARIFWEPDIEDEAYGER